MKIKLALLEKDPNYLKRIVPAFNMKYANELEIYSFTDVESAMQALEDKKIDVFLASDSFKIDFSSIPKRCGFSYLVDNANIDRIDNRRAVCKYQKAELIYKYVLSIYSEQVPNITGISGSENGSMKTIAFTSPCGGVGTSTVAAACAIAFAKQDCRVLYLSTEVFGSADTYFSCDGQFNFGDVIYAVKSNKTNRALKLQSTVKQDVTGVSFYSSVRIPLDMMQMQPEDYEVLQNELKMLGDYDYVIMDVEFPRTESGFKLFERCNYVIMVTDSSETANSKIEKAIRAVEILDEHSEYAIQPRMQLLQNKAAANTLTMQEIRLLGSIPAYQYAAPAQMARQLSMSDVFMQLM